MFAGRGIDIREVAGGVDIDDLRDAAERYFGDESGGKGPVDEKGERRREKEEKREEKRERKEERGDGRGKGHEEEEQQGGLFGRGSGVFGGRMLQAAEKAALKPSVLDGSAWPIVHGSRGSMDNTPLAMPTTATGPLTIYSSQHVDDRSFGTAQIMMAGMLASGQGMDSLTKQAAALMDFNIADANPVSIITQKLNDKEQLLWTSTIGKVLAYKHTTGKPDLTLMASFERDLNFRFHGSYALVASTGGSPGFFTTMDDSLVRYALVDVKDEEDGLPYSIQETGRVALPAELNADKTDHLVGVTLLDDGSVVVCSKHGLIMAAKADASGKVFMTDVLRLGDFTKTDNSEVSNSISSSGQSIYIATQQEMARVDLDPAALSLAFKWSTVYGPQEPWYVGRLGPGSGSTPTVTSCQGRELVTITDGALPMNLLWYDTKDGSLVGGRKVQFGADEAASAPTTSEQSVAVDGCKAFVVQNYMGMSSVDPDVFCAIAPQGGELRAKVPNICAALMPANSTDLFIPRACPPSMGCASFGAAMYEVDPSTKTASGLSKVQRLWARDDVSCGTSIPLVSQHNASHAAYCIGLNQGSPQWSVLGMDVDTGKEVLNYPFYTTSAAQNYFANPYYAGVEAIGPNEMVIGSVGGVLYISPLPTKGGRGARSMAAEAQVTVSKVFKGDFEHVNVTMAAVLGALALFLLTVFAVIIKKTHRALSPRLPDRV